MVVERFGGEDCLRAVGERFRERGRMIPEGSGVAYMASWMSADGSRCYQLMEAPSPAALEGWVANWSDLVAFEVEEVSPSAEFWAGRREGGAG